MTPSAAPLTLSQVVMKRRRLPPFIDFSAFFLFFGISGTDGDRQRRLDERFLLEFYPCLVSGVLSRPLPPGRYRLDGLPEAANKRGWSAHGASRLTADLSEEGWDALQGWLARGERRVQPVRLGDLSDG